MKALTILLATAFLFIAGCAHTTQHAQTPHSSASQESESDEDINSAPVRAPF